MHCYTNWRFDDGSWSYAWAFRGPLCKASDVAKVGAPDPQSRHIPKRDVLDRTSLIMTKRNLPLAALPLPDPFLQLVIRNGECIWRPGMQSGGWEYDEREQCLMITARICMASCPSPAGHEPISAAVTISQPHSRFEPSSHPYVN